MEAVNNRFGANQKQVLCSLRIICGVLDELGDAATNKRDCCITDFHVLCFQRSQGIVSQGIPGVCKACPASLII